MGDRNRKNDSDMEISEDDGENTEENANSEYGVCSESGEHRGFDNCEPDLE